MCIPQPFFSPAKESFVASPSPLPSKQRNRIASTEFQQWLKGRTGKNFKKKKILHQKYICPVFFKVLNGSVTKRGKWFRRIKN